MKRLLFFVEVVLFVVLGRKSKLKYVALALLPLVLVGCDIVTDVSRHGNFRAILGHPVVTRRPLQLDELNYALNKYDDKYDLDGRTVGRGLPIVGVIPKGHPVLFQNVLSRVGFNTDEVYLVGTVEFHGKTYPFTYSGGVWAPEKTEYEKLWQGLRYDFVIPEAIHSQ